MTRNFQLSQSGSQKLLERKKKKKKKIVTRKFGNCRTQLHPLVKKYKEKKQKEDRDEKIFA